MHPPSTPTPLTVGKLLGRTIGLYRTHSGIFLRTVAIFYVPVAALSFFFVEDNATSFLFTLLVWPVEAIVNLSLISHCVESLHGRPLAVRTAIGRGLRRLPAHIGMTLATTAIYGGVALVWAIPIWVGLLNADIPFDEIRYAFSDLVSRGDIEGFNNLLGNALWGGHRFLSYRCPDTDRLSLSVGSLDSCRGRTDGRRDGSSGLLGAQLESEPGLRSAFRGLSNSHIHSYGISRRIDRSVGGFCIGFPASGL